MPNVNPHDISLQDAAQLTENFRNTHTAPSTIIAHSFDKASISGIINQTGCCGVRIYYAQDGAGVPKLVITGIDVSGNDMYNGKLAEYGNACPVACSSSNPLNTSPIPSPPTP